MPRAKGIRLAASAPRTKPKLYEHEATLASVATDRRTNSDESGYPRYAPVPSSALGAETPSNPANAGA
jgi:hypothetical protein